MILTLQPVLVRTGSDENGSLVFADGRLVAVLVRLSEENEVAPGAWYLEAGFGPALGRVDHPTFSSLDAARDWIAQRLATSSVAPTEAGPVNRFGRRPIAKAPRRLGPIAADSRQGSYRAPETAS